MTRASAVQTDPYAKPKAQLAGIVDGLFVERGVRLDVAYIGNIRNDAPRPSKRATPFYLEDPTAPNGIHEFNLRIPSEGTRKPRSILVVYATAGFLSCWDRMEEDVESLLVGRQQVVIVFLQPQFARLAFESHSYFFSALLSALPRRKFVTRLEVYISPKDHEEAADGASAAPNQGKGVLKHLLTYIGKAISRQKDEDGTRVPRCFSALVISVTPRRKTG